MFFFHITPHQTATIPVRFGRIVSDEPWLPGLHFKSCFTKAVDIFTGFDKDEVKYTCGTKDGVRFGGTVVVTNRVPVENVMSAYQQYGEKPDRQNVYDMGEYFMQSICSNMTAREFYVDKFDILDDLLEERLVEGQKALYDSDGTLIRPATGVQILKGKVKVFKPKPINSNVDELIKKEAEHRQAVRTAIEERKVDQALADNMAAKQKAELERDRARNQQAEQRHTDTQRAELERAQAKLDAEQKRLETQIQMQYAEAARDANVTLTLADAQARKTVMEAESNQKLLTPEYLKSKAIDAFYHNSKMVMGDSIPTAWLNQADMVLN